MGRVLWGGFVRARAAGVIALDPVAARRAIDLLTQLEHARAATDERVALDLECSGGDLLPDQLTSFLVTSVL